MIYARNLALFLGVAAVGAPMNAGAANLMKDGGFERPPSSPNFFTTYGPGQKIGPWTVIGSGNVATVNDYNEGGVLWSAHQGRAFLDLTGTCDCGANSGVAQNVKTVPGTTYVVTFFVGNTYIEGQGLTSTVDVYAGSTLLLAAANKSGKGKATEVWKKFETSFVASANKTTISFVNGDPSGDEQDGLDAVSVKAQ